MLVPQPHMINIKQPKEHPNKPRVHKSRNRRDTPQSDQEWADWSDPPTNYKRASHGGNWHSYDWKITAASTLLPKQGCSDRMPTRKRYSRRRDDVFQPATAHSANSLSIGVSFHERRRLSMCMCRPVNFTQFENTHTHTHRVSLFASIESTL